jgi:Zn-dependent metalloprotease
MKNLPRQFTPQFGAWTRLAALLLSFATAANTSGAATFSNPAPSIGANPIDIASRLDQLSLRPLSQAPHFAPTSTATTAPDPKTRAMARKLRKQISKLQMRSQAARPVTLNREQSEGLARLREKVGESLTIKGRRGAQTPRMIRGAKLEHAVAMQGPRKDRAEQTARAFLRSNRALLRLDDPDTDMKLHKKKLDELGRTHLRFQQHYRGLRVWPAELIVHLDPDGDVDLMNGAYVETPRGLGITPSVLAHDAIERARRRLPDSANAAISQPELIIYAPGDIASRLAWDVRVPISVTSSWRVVVDARSGAILTAYDTVMTENVTGSGQDLSSQTQALNVWHESGTYYMVDTSKPMYQIGSNPPLPNETAGAITILDARNQPPTSDVFGWSDPIPLYNTTSSLPNAGWIADGVSAAANFAYVYDYYYNEHNQDSMDGEGLSLLAIVRLGQNFANAYYNPAFNLMGFGDAEPFAGALDVVAHELTHGVTEHSANLVYQNESGALNESFSDIFGESVEAYVSGTPDWLLGSPPLSAPQRDMQDPSSMMTFLGVPYPDKYSNFIETTEDNGGVHLNSSIPNHAFYQFADGLPNAVGMAKAGKIFFRALTVHLVANSEFIDARLACIQAADELYGVGSVEAQATADAFDHVEIFDGANTEDPPDYPSVDSTDATLFLAYDVDGYYLARQEPPDDPAAGSWLGLYPVGYTRPAVTGDGSVAIFVDAWNDICFIQTDLSQPEEDCLGFPDSTASVAISPDGNLFGLVSLDLFGDPDNVITIIDFTKPAGEDVTEYTLRAPAIDGEPIATVRYADAMDFTADGRLIFYDALNTLPLPGGGTTEVWSIYAIDMTTGATFTVVLPFEGFDIAFPAVSQTSDNFVTFDVVDQFSGDSYIVAGNLNTGESNVVGYNPWGFGAPGFNGDDSAIVYSYYDGCITNTCTTLVSQPVAADRITPEGIDSEWLADADYGVIYRRGTYVPEPGLWLQQFAGISLLALLCRRRKSRANLRAEA